MKLSHAWPITRGETYRIVVDQATNQVRTCSASNLDWNNYLNWFISSIPPYITHTPVKLSLIVSASLPRTSAPRVLARMSCHPHSKFAVQPDLSSSRQMEKLVKSSRSTGSEGRTRARARNGRFLPKGTIVPQVEEEPKVCGWCSTTTTTQWRFGPQNCSRGT